MSLELALNLFTLIVSFIAIGISLHVIISHHMPRRKK